MKMDYSNRNQNDRYNDSNNDRDQNRRDNDDNNGQHSGRGNNDSRNQYENFQNRNRRDENGGNNDYQNRNRRDDNMSGRSNFNSPGNQGNEGNQWERQGNNDRSQGFGNDRNQYGNDRGNSGSGYNSRGQNYSGSNRQDDRGWIDRTKDEVSSWFGDDDAEKRRRMDKTGEGQHRGKGPKGYKRSDDRLKDDINDRLSDDAHVDASDIEVTVSNGEVTLTGTVDRRETKRRAEDVAESVSGVAHIQNNLRVGQQSNINSASGNSGSVVTGGTAGSALSSSTSSAGTNGHHKAKAAQ